MAKILFAEDEKSIADVVSDLLTGQRYHVDHVDNGEEALRRLKFYAYDMVILDWNLPEMEGVEVCRSFRLAGGTTPILMLTGKRDIDDRESGLDAGADD